MTDMLAAREVVALRQEVENYASTVEALEARCRDLRERAERAEAALREVSADRRLAAFAAKYGTGSTLRLQYDHPPAPTEEPWRIEWRRFYPDAGFSDRREVEASSLRQAIEAAEEWESENDALAAPQPKETQPTTPTQEDRHE